MSDESLNEQCSMASAALERALNLPPLQVSREADVAERAIVKVRDELIGRLRANSDPATTRTQLDRANVALCLVAALEYPVGGTPRHSIQGALNAVQAITQ